MIVEYIAKKPRKVRGTDVKVGDKLYAVRKNGVFFIWSYTNKEMAEYMDGRLSGPSSEIDRQCNWRTFTDQLCPSSTNII